MSKIIIVSELFYPDNASTAYIMTKIADKLSERHDVEVICGNGNYENDLSISIDQEKNYTIHRIRQGKFDKNKILSRLISFSFLSIKLSKKLFSISKRGDKVLIVTNPAPFIILCSLIKKIKLFDLTVIIQDVFPENAVAAGIIKSKKNIGYRILKSLFNRAYSSSDRLIVIGRDMAKLFSEKLSPNAPPLFLIENWADPSDNKHIISSNSGPVKLLFAGNIGRCQGLEDFTELFGKVNNPNIKFQLRGGGAVVQTLKNIIHKRNFTNIDIGDTYTRDEQFEILGNCDIALVTLCDGMYGLGVPSKSYNIMSAGKPILFVGDPMSEIALVIKESKIGYVFSNTDKDGLTNWLNMVNEDIRTELKDMGLRAKELAKTCYSEDAILSKYANLFDSL